MYEQVSSAAAELQAQNCLCFAVPMPSQVGRVADEALEALSGSLGKREPDPDENKPAVDKVKVEKQPDLKK